MKDAQKLKKDTENFFQHLVDESDDIHIVINPSGGVLYANLTAKQCLHFPLQESESIPLNIIYSDYHSEGQFSEKKKLTLNEIYELSDEDKEIEIILHFSDLKQSLVKIRATEVEWKKEKAYELTLRDVTHLQQIVELEKELAEKTRVEKLKDEFISVVSHELRTPLTIIKGAISNLYDGIVGPLGEKQKEVVATTLRNTERLTRIINNLLDLSRLESGRAKMNRCKVTAQTLLSDLKNNFENEIAKSGIVMETKIQPNLTEVFVDPDMIHQVLTNLINNAVRFAKNKIYISGSMQQIPNGNLDPQAFVKITVEDDGKGIDKNNQKKLFNKFEQIHRSSGGTGYKGTGLGLAISKEIISLHHGDIWVESDTGKGCRFCFTLPCYHEREQLCQELQKMISVSEEKHQPLAVVSMGIANLCTIKELCTEKDIDWMINDISKEIHRKALRNTDIIKYQRDSKEFIIILNDTGQKEANTIVKRIHNLTKECFCPGKTGKIYADLSIGIAVFPDDEKDANLLMEISLKEKR